MNYLGRNQYSSLHKALRELRELPNVEVFHPPQHKRGKVPQFHVQVEHAVHLTYQPSVVKGNFLHEVRRVHFGTNHVARARPVRHVVTLHGQLDREDGAVRERTPVPKGQHFARRNEQDLLHHLVRDVRLAGGVVWCG